VVNNASLFEYDDVAELHRAAMERHWRANTAPAIAAGARCTHAARGDGAGLRGQPARPEALEPEPRLPELHAVQGGAEAATTLLAQALAPRCASAAWRPA
jgi:hypothetical protein